MDPPFKDAVLRHRRILMETYVIPMGIPWEDKGKESGGKVLRNKGVLWETYGDLFGSCVVPVWFGPSV